MDSHRQTKTGLDYFGARYFSGPMGRFTSPDPFLNSRGAVVTRMECKMGIFLYWGALVTLMGGFAFAQTSSRPERMVPDATTAIDVAKVVLKALYGRDFLRRKVFTATEREGIWIIVGQPKLPPDRTAMGGVTEVSMRSADAQITSIHLQL